MSNARISLIPLPNFLMYISKLFWFFVQDSAVHVYHFGKDPKETS